MKVLGINGSPRKYGNAHKLLLVALEGARSEGAEVDVIHLYDARVEPCLGCVSDSERLCRYPCVIDDDMRWIYERLLEADGFVLATPVYWYGVSGVMKNFIDRLTALENMIYFDGRSWLEGKVAAFIATGNDVGALAVIQYLMAVLNSMGVLVPPWALAYYEERGDALDKRSAVMDAWNLGRIAAIAARMVKGSGVERWYIDDEKGLKVAASVKETVRRWEEERAERRKRIEEALKRLPLLEER